MNWIVAKIKWIMLVAGALTCSMLYAVVMPSQAIDFLFDRSLDSFGRLIVPSWAAMIGIVGAMLIYGAFVPHVRTLVLNVASASKLVFLGLMLAQGRRYLEGKVGLVIALDVVMVTLFIVFMIGLRRAGMRREPLSPPAMAPAPRAQPTMQVPPRPPAMKTRV